MSWTYSDYVTYDRTSATRLTRLRLHIQEVSEKIDTEVSADGKSEQLFSLRLYLDRLLNEEKDLEQRAGRCVNGGVSRIRLGRAR